MSPFSADEAEVIDWLATGRESARLRRYFGEALYRELVPLAQQARRAPLRRKQRVLILPGMMGSTLGKPRRVGPPDLLWVDPIEIALGRLPRLAWPKGKSYRALGVLLYGYLRLKLVLRGAGYNVDYHPYDWRRDLTTLGSELAARIASESGKTSLIAHSYGGLVARAALALSASRQIERLIFLGTPHRGAISTVQALRGTYPLVRRLAALDLKHSPIALARQLLTTLPGLAALVPDQTLCAGLDLFAATNWPKRGPAPAQTLLRQAANQRETLPAADERCVVIAGVGKRTPIGLEPDADGFVYRVSTAGDGTVPLASAELPGAPTWYVKQSHGALANDAAVGAAVLELLASGTTDSLSPMPPVIATRSQLVSGRELQVLPQPKVGTRGPSAALQRALLTEFVAVPVKRKREQHSAVAPVRRPPRSALSIDIQQTSLTDLKVDAVVAGVFRSVEAGGAAGSLDRRLGGALRELLARRLFVADAGAVFVLPVAAKKLRARFVVLAGLGDFDAFTPATQRQVTTNVARVLVAAGVRSAGIVLMGAASGINVETALREQLRGYLDGFAGSGVVKRLVLTSREVARSKQMRTTIAALASHAATPLRLQPARPAALKAATPVPTSLPRSVYLLTRQQSLAAGAIAISTSLLTATDKAAILAGSREFPAITLDRLLGRLGVGPLSVEEVRRFGTELAALVLPEDIRRALADLREYPLIIVHDADGGRVPWEALCIDNWQPAAERGLSRRYAADGLPIARWREQRQLGETLELMLVVNPTGDLPGAEEEGNRVRAVLAEQRSIKVTELRGEQATRERLMREFRSGRYDVLHYAGHAYFDTLTPERSGILCAGGVVLAGEDLPSLEHLPALVFFNACESGRVRTRAARPQRMREGTSLAETFLRGGVANYLGTWWSVGDAAAAAFAARFYSSLLAGQSMGDAVLSGRAAVRALRSGDWADYLHYGSADFRLLKGPEGGDS